MMSKENLCLCLCWLLCILTHTGQCLDGSSCSFQLKNNFNLSTLKSKIPIQNGSCNIVHSDNGNLMSYGANIDILENWPTFSQTFILKTDNISLQCKEGIENLQNGVKNLELWALKMIDSSAKIPSGILSGNVNQYGHFDQCLEVESAQYCLVEIDFTSKWHKSLEYLKNLVHSYFLIRGSFEDPVHRIPSFSIIRWGICLPKECTPRDIETGIANAFGANVYMRNKMCQTNIQKPIYFGDKLARGLFAALVMAIFISTTFSYLKLDTILSYENKLFQVLMAFSLQKNWKSLTTISGEEGIRSVDGLRGLAALGLIVCHKYMSLLFNPHINRTQLAKSTTLAWSIVGRTAILYTDAFVLISGLLSSRTIITDFENQNFHKLKERVVNRIFRIAPNMIAVILFCTYILPNLGSGPLWPIVINHHAELCKSYMWRNFLFIHNYFGFENMCLTHSHQIGIDMQLFLFMIVMLYITWKNKKIGLILMVTIAVLSTVLRFIVTYQKGISHLIYFGITISKLFDTANFSYILPTHRATIYIMGILMAFILRSNYSFPRNKMEAAVMWFISMTIGFSVYLGPLHTTNINYKYNPWEAALYGAFSPIMCGFGVCWVIYASNNGYGGWFGDFLSWKGFKYFSKISYAVYLTQFPIYFFNVGLRRYAEEYTPFAMFQIPEVLSIIFMSIILTLCVEMPFITISKILFQKPKISNKVNNVSNSDYTSSKCD